MSKILVIAGLGTGGGTGGAVARRFAKSGYRVALLARGADTASKISEEIKSSGGSAAPFPVQSYSHSELSRVFAAIKKEWPNDPIRVAVWNAGDGVWKKFLEVTEEDLAKTQGAITGAFAFSREAILAFKNQDIDERGGRGSLIFTGATSATRGNVITSAFSAGKFAARALSQSLAKEFGKENIHVSHVIVDGVIATERSPKGPDGEDTDDVRLSPDAIAEAYEYIATQHRSFWTWELDARPAHEKW